MSYWECHYHVIWATERRYPALTIEREQAAGELILSICRELGVPMLGIGMVEDRVHLAVSIPPRHAVSEVVRRIKGATSTLLRKNEGSTSWPGWQTEYGVVTFSGR